VPHFGTLPGRAALGRRPRRRLRVALRRQPIAFWTLAAVAVGATWWGTHVATDKLTAGAQAYGALVEVVVTTRDIAAGERIEPADIRLAELPRDLVPDGAISRLEPGATARDPLVAGEAIVPARLATLGAEGLAASLAPDERAVAIPIDGHRPELRIGQRVDVLASTPPSSTATRPDTRTIADNAEVVDVDEGGITVEVSVDEAHDIATALGAALITVVVTPG
jgi:pilus assembly protein CpaB